MFKMRLKKTNARRMRCDVTFRWVIFLFYYSTNSLLVILALCHTVLSDLGADIKLAMSCVLLIILKMFYVQTLVYGSCRGWSLIINREPAHHLSPLGTRRVVDFDCGAAGRPSHRISPVWGLHLATLAWRFSSQLSSLLANSSVSCYL